VATQKEFLVPGAPQNFYDLRCWRGRLRNLYIISVDVLYFNTKELIKSQVVDENTLLGAGRRQLEKMRAK